MFADFLKYANLNVCTINYCYALDYTKVNFKILPENTYFSIEYSSSNSVVNFEFDFEDQKESDEVLENLSKLTIVNIKINKDVGDKELLFIMDMLKLPKMQIYLKEVVLKLPTLNECINVVNLLYCCTNLQVIELYYKTYTTSSKAEDLQRNEIKQDARKNIQTLKKINIYDQFCSLFTFKPDPPIKSKLESAYQTISTMKKESKYNEDEQHEQHLGNKESNSSCSKCMIF